MNALYVGAISGTSVDGLDLALVDIADNLSSATLRVVSTHSATLPEELRKDLLRLGQGDADDEVELLGHTDTALGHFIGSTIVEFLAAAGQPKAAIRAIGSHGQTVRHRPTGERPFTLQIGDPNQISEITGITTVADFRRRDMAAGGQGAPLVPPFHQALFSHQEERRVVLNVGGISNLTLLFPGEPVRGYDTGPGNALMDAWINKQRGLSYDEAGSWARTGKCSEDLLGKLLSDDYFGLAAPKSTGREHFNLDWLERQLDPGIKPEDVQATLVALW